MVLRTLEPDRTWIAIHHCTSRHQLTLTHIEDDRELCRRANADRDPEIEFRLELKKEVRAKDASDCHAGLQVVRDRIFSIEGSCAVINTRFQERDRPYQQLRSQQRHDDEFRLPAADLEQELNHGDC